MRVFLLLLFLYEFLLDVYIMSHYDDFVGERWVQPPISGRYTLRLNVQ